MPCISKASSWSRTWLNSKDRECLYSHLLSDKCIQRHKFIYCFRFVPKFLACHALSVSHQGSHLSRSVVSVPGNRLTQKDNIDSGVQFITPASPRQRVSSQPRTPTNFCETLNTLSVLLKSTSPNSLNLAWTVLKGDTKKLQP